MTEKIRIRVNERPCTCIGDCKVLRVEASYGTAKVNYSWCAGSHMEVSDFFEYAKHGLLTEIDETEEYVFGSDCLCDKADRAGEAQIYNIPITELRWSRDESFDLDGCEGFLWSDHGYNFLDYFDNPEHSYLGPDIHGVGITHAGVRLVTGRRYNVVQPVETEDAEQQSSYDDQGFLRMNDNDRYEAAFADAHESPNMEQESGCAHAHERVADAVSCYSSQNEALAGSEGWWVEGYGVARLSDGLMLSKNDIEFIAMTQETGV